MTRTFWQELVLGLVVVALAAFWIAGAFNPNKEAQAVLSDNTNQSIATVKANVASTMPAIVRGADVIQSVATTCVDGSSYTVNILNSAGIRLASYTTNPGTGTSLITTVVADVSKYYSRTQSGNIINFQLQP